MNKTLFFACTGLTLALCASVAEATPIGVTSWSQGPDMVNAEDNLSMHRSFGPVVADDFVSNGKEILGFTWWGSYFMDAHQSTDPAAVRDIQFEIAFHENDPTSQTFDTPEDLNYFSRIYTATEVFFGTTLNGVDIFEYSVWLDPMWSPSFLGNTWQPNAGDTYWATFAWNANQAFNFGLSAGDDIWGWAKAANGESCIGNCAVTTAPGGPANPHIGPWHSLDPEDKAFEVITIPEPGVLTLLGIGLVAMGLARRKKA